MRAEYVADFTLRVDRNGQGNFITVGVLHNLAVTWNLAFVSIVDSAPSLEDLPKFLRNFVAAEITCLCVSTDETLKEIIGCYFMKGMVMEWQIALPKLGVATGLFYIAKLAFSDEIDANIQFDLALQSAGRLTFIACRESPNSGSDKS